MALFIRHGKDRYSRSTDTRIDTSLTSSGKDQARYTGKTLFRMYGAPSEIRCSPFKRGRETARRLAEYAKRHGYDVPIIVDIGLSRYTNQDTARLRGDTAKYGEIPLEEKHEFKRRVREYSEAARDRFFETGKIVWYVTHGIVVRGACKHFEMRCPHMVGSCQWADIITANSQWVKRDQ